MECLLWPSCPCPCPCSHVEQQMDLHMRPWHEDDPGRCTLIHRLSLDETVVKWWVYSLCVRGGCKCLWPEEWTEVGWNVIQKYLLALSRGRVCFLPHQLTWPCDLPEICEWRQFVSLLSRKCKKQHISIFLSFLFHNLVPDVSWGYTPELQRADDME